MPVIIDHDIPAIEGLAAQGINILRTTPPGVKPLEVLFLNLMPNKMETEFHWLRALHTPDIYIHVTFCRILENYTRNDPADHMDRVYKTFDQVRDQHFDAFVMTGAPLEKHAFTDVFYWDQIQDILTWANKNVASSLLLCWASFAALKHHHAYDPQILPKKFFGIYDHHALPHLLTNGLNEFPIPTARWMHMQMPPEKLDVIVTSDDVGPAVLIEDAGKRTYMLNHLEYDAHTLNAEYRTNVKAGIMDLPHRYFPDDDPTQPPQNTWENARKILFGNWVRLAASRAAVQGLEKD